MTSREGALVEPLSVGLHGVNRSRIAPGSPCVIMGAGPVGLAALMWCKAKGAGPIVVSELTPGRREMALKLGATAVVNPKERNPAAVVKEHCGRLPQVVFECIGVKSTLNEAIGLVDKLRSGRSDGRVHGARSDHAGSVHLQGSEHGVCAGLHPRRFRGDPRRAGRPPGSTPT